VEDKVTAFYLSMSKIEVPRSPDELTMSCHNIKSNDHVVKERI
jgi:hypothetical protein